MLIAKLYERNHGDSQGINIIIHADLLKPFGACMPKVIFALKNGPELFMAGTQKVSCSGSIWQTWAIIQTV